MTASRTCGVVLCLLFVITLSEGNSPSCRDENGKTVDWFYLYKLPKDNDENSGLKYMYMSSEDSTHEWKLSNHTIDEIASFPGQTISPFLNNSKNFLIAYNDAPPNEEDDAKNGHTKGVIAADTKTGFWLVHSVPNYPPIKKYDYPNSATIYGQSFLCITLNAEQISVVGSQLLFNEPHVYYARMPDTLQTLYPNFVKVIAQKWHKNAPFSNTENIFSVNNVKFKSFAKNRKFSKELYEDLVAPTLNTDLLVESWRHGPGNLPTNCSRTTRVFNVADITLAKINFSFHSTKDHSKWCVADNEDQGWICVGDINRASHQLSRGGGTVCQHNEQVAKAYRDLVEKFEKCPQLV